MQGEALDLDVSLRRAAVAYRALGTVWLLSLAIIELVVRRQVEFVWVGSTMALVVGWSFLTAAAAEAAPRLLGSWTWLAVDLMISMWTVHAPAVAGAENFYGGYPMSTVFVAVAARGPWAAIVTSFVLALNALTRTLVEAREAGASLDPTQVSGGVIVFVFAGLAVAWAVSVLRNAERSRRNAEEALSAAQEQRARAEERAGLAARIHDSVLQALALIQRSDDAAEMRSLARAQERELRSWLFQRGDAREGFLVDAVRAACAEVEDRYHVRVELVTVGDVPVTEPVEALIEAGREALVNAAKHAGVEVVSAYAEADGSGVTLYVRDRGTGFDPASVPADRRGLAESIVGRMARHGGTAEVRSSPGQGTEVKLVVRNE